MTTDIKSHLLVALMSLWEDIPGFRNLGVSLVAQTMVTAAVLTPSEHW